MQSAKCKVQSECIAYGDYFKFVGFADTFILHLAFCILHSSFSSK